MALVGWIARAHGIRGQVIVNPETDFPEERFQPGAELFVERGGAVQTLTVTTDDPKQPEIKIPVQAVVQAELATAARPSAPVSPPVSPSVSPPLK